MARVHNLAADTKDRPVVASPLSLIVQPIPGEGIANLVFRAAAENGYQNTSYVFTDAPCGWRYSNRISRSSTTDLRVIATRVTGADPDSVLTDMLHLGPNGELGKMAFYGATINASHFQFSNRRRVSTAHLRQASHMKDIWSIKPLIFDPQSLDILISHCPVCKREFGYAQTFGVHFCDKCYQIDEYGNRRGSVDLRDFVQPCIEPDDREALDFVTSLIDPDSDARTRLWGRLPAELSDLGRGRVFDASVELSKLIDRDIRAFRPTGTAVDAAEGLHPRSLELVGRAFLDWPRGLDEMVRVIQGFSTGRPGFFGIVKEFGLLSNALWSRTIPSVIQMRLRECLGSATFGQNASAVRRIENRVQIGVETSTVIARKYGLCQRTVSGMARDGKVNAISVSGFRAAPLLIEEEGLKKIVLQRRFRSSASQVAKCLGIPTASAFRLMKWQLSLSSLSVDTPDVISSCVSALEAMVHGAVNSSAPFGSGIPLKDALFAIGYPTGDPWCALFEAVGERKLPISLMGGQGPLASILTIQSLPELAAVLETSEQRIYEDEASNLVQAAIVLNTHYNNALGLQRIGILPRKIKENDIYAACRLVAFSSEAIWRLGRIGVRVVPRTLTGFLAERGIVPLAVSPFGKKKIWRRSDLERLMADVHQAAGPNQRSGPCSTDVRSSTTAVQSDSVASRGRGRRRPGV